MSVFLMATAMAPAIAQVLPPLDRDDTAAPASAKAPMATPAPATISEVTSTSANQDVVVKNFIPDWQVSRLVQEGFDEAGKKAEQPKTDTKTAAPAKPAVTKKTTTAASPKVDTKAAKLLSEPAKSGPQLTPEEKELAARKAQEAADRANGIVRDTKTTAKPAPRAKDTTPVALDDKEPVKQKTTTAKTESTPKEPAMADATQPEKTVVKTIPIAPGKSMTVKSSIKDGEEVASSESTTNAGAIETGRNGRLRVEGRVSSVNMGQGGRLRLMIDAGAEGSVQVVVEPRIGMRVPRTGAQVVASGKKIGGGGGSIVMRADSIDRSSRASVASRSSSANGTKRYRSESPSHDPLAARAMTAPVPRGRVAVDPYMHPGPMMMPPPPPMVGGPMMGGPMLPPPPIW